jgi:hypothetical protein
MGRFPPNAFREHLIVFFTMTNVEFDILEQLVQQLRGFLVSKSGDVDQCLFVLLLTANPPV